jgi:phosphoglycolate phosphatase
MKAVIFDLDGTLLDTIDDIRSAINYARAAYDGVLVSREDTRRYVGNGLFNALKKSFIEHGPVLESEDEFSLIFQLMMGYYKNHPADHAYPYEGVMELLWTLKKKGVKCAILSNKADSIVQDMLSKSFGDFVFDFAIGHRDDFPLKPNAASLYYVLEKLGVDKEDVIYIGDSEVDYKTAINAGVKHIIVTYGFRDRSDLEKAGVVNLFDHMPSYEELLDGYRAQLS